MPTFATFATFATSATSAPSAASAASAAMSVFTLKVLTSLAVLATSIAFLWFSTPWGYKKSTYQRVVRPGSWLDDPQLLRGLGLGGFLYGLIGSLLTMATGLEELIRAGRF